MCLFVFCLFMASANGARPADSLNCTLAGRWAHGPCDALALKNRMAFFGDGLFLTIVDFQDFTYPVQRGRLIHASPVRAVAVDGTHAYTIEENEILHVYNYSDPDHPVQVGSVEVGHYVRAVVVSGSHLYLACYTDGLYTYDVSTPSDPVQVSWFDTRGSAEDVAV
jgi:hypothetical protein